MSTAANLLQLLDSKKGQSPEELATKMNLSKARLFQVAKTLSDSGALVRKGDRFSGVKYYLGDSAKFVEKPARVKVAKTAEERAERGLSKDARLVLDFMSCTDPSQREELRQKIYEARGLDIKNKPSVSTVSALRLRSYGNLPAETSSTEDRPGKVKRKSYYKPKRKK